MRKLAATSGTSDPTQHLLSALGRLQNELTVVETGKATARWVDECMNHLILAMEVALQDGWLEMVEALADAGRILQSYDNAKQSTRAVWFLNESYELLCNMIGDSIVDDERSANTDAWRAHYQEAVLQLEAQGIPLASDNEEGDSSEPANASASGDDLPFEMPSLHSTAPKSRLDDELPTLDELPPLDGLLDIGHETTKTPRAALMTETPRSTESETEDALVESLVAEKTTATDDDIFDTSIGGESARPAATAQESTSPQGTEPTRLVIDVMDRICDELARLEGNIEEQSRKDAIETIEGGIQALQREAKEHRQADSASLAESMLEVCQRAMESPKVVDERFTELAFGFCGVYVEAMDGESENVRQWSTECVALMSSWDMDDTGTEEIATELEDKSEAPVKTQSPFEPLSETVEKLDTSEPKAPAELPREPATAPPTLEAAIEEKEDNAAEIKSAELETEATPSQPAPSPVPARPGRHRTEELLARAQEAALRGNTKLAQQLALQAAASIGELDIESAQNDLSTAEGRLRTCLDEIEHARETVRTCDQNLAKSEELVNEGERNLQQVEVKTSKSRKDMDVLQGQVDDLNRQIEELQAKLEVQVQQAAAASAAVEEHQSEQHEMERELAMRHKGVANARAELEMARQSVKTKQRTVSEIESDIVRVREALHEKQASLKSIQTTLPVAGTASSEDNSAQENLF